jgi:hypothetical protein
MLKRVFVVLSLVFCSLGVVFGRSAVSREHWIAPRTAGNVIEASLAVVVEIRAILKIDDHYIHGAVHDHGDHDHTAEFRLRHPGYTRSYDHGLEALIFSDHAKDAENVEHVQIGNQENAHASIHRVDIHHASSHHGDRVAHHHEIWFFHHEDRSV